MGISSASQILNMQPKTKDSVTGRDRLSGDLLLKFQPNYFPRFRKSTVVKDAWCWSCQQGALDCLGRSKHWGVFAAVNLCGRSKLTQTSMVLACFENMGKHTRCWTCGKKWHGDADCGSRGGGSRCCQLLLAMLCWQPPLGAGG